MRSASRRHFHLSLVALSSLLLMAATDAAAKIPKQMRGKIFYASKVEDSGLRPLLKKLKRAKSKAEVPRAKDKHWKGVLVAFFKRTPYPGPITIWVTDMADKGALKDRSQATHVTTVEKKKPAEYLVWDMDLDPNDGLNKGRSYRVEMGQIIGKRTRIYAKGELTLGK